MNQRFKKTIALVLVAVMIGISIGTVFSIAHEIEEAGFSSPHKISIAFLHVESSGHCPACPTDNHPSDDHDHYSCDHHTNISLSAQAVYRHPVPMGFLRVNVEPFQFIPEVYLDKFIPPQNLV